MKRDKNVSKKIAVISFVVYLFLLMWIIVFKFRMDFSSLTYIRSVNLIPFKENGFINGISGTVINLLLFFPIGMYLQVIMKKIWMRGTLLLTIAVIYEILQYIFHCGVSDITDVIMRMIGGVVGVMLIRSIYRLFSDQLDKYGVDEYFRLFSPLIPMISFGLLFIV